ncbi:MAG: helix-turn-helix domain-containing protein [Lachnospiraceae bacterium]|nr:helix-turn-helix domain-containing protein [Lachnospiraceae bacterium]
MTQEALATKLGYKNKSTIAKIENGTNDIVQSKVVEFAEALDTTVAYLMGWDNENPALRTLTNVHPIEIKSFPMLGEISCGAPKFTNEDRESYVQAGTDIRADFCLTARGDSMINARIHDGDIVFIRQQDMVENGEIAAVVVNNDSEATLKRLYYYKEQALLILRAENPAYADQVYSGEQLNEVHILGKAVAFQSDVQ